MRTKTTILSIAVILITALVLCSCNLDATDGIYSEIADSTESTSVTLKAYLGQYGTEYYYLTDEAVRKIGSSDAVFSSNSSSIVRAASLLDPATGKFLVLREDTSTLKSSLSYYATPTSDAVELGQFNGLLTNGLFFDSTKIYRCNGGVADPVVSYVSVQDYLTNGDYAFFSVKDTDGNYKFYVIKSDGTQPLSAEITGSSKTYVGFQPLPSGKDFILLNYDSSKAKSNLYVLAYGDTEVTSEVYTTLKSSIPYAYATQAASFIYTADEKTYVVFKCSSYFDKVRISDDDSDGEVTQVSTGFAANLRTADVTNILATDTANVFIAGTVGSMLYEINMNEDSSTQKK